MDCFDSAHSLEPFESLVHHVDREHRRSVEHRKLVDVGAVVKHRRNIPADLSERFLVDDGESHAGRACVLLCATVDEGILADVNPAAEDVG